MKTNLFFLGILSMILLSSCEVNQSVKIDLLSGLSTKGSGLSARDVYLTIDDKKVNRNTFTYGERFYLNFNDVTGFQKEGNNVFPGMELAVLGESGDTVMYYEDLYADKSNGVDVSPLLLNSYLTVAKPMMSNNSYTLLVNIWDKKGTGTYKAEFKYDIKPNEHILVEASDGISYDNIYLFSKEKGTVVDNKVNVGETYYMLIEGAEGFTATEGKISVGLSMKATDKSGELIFDQQDMLGDGAWEIDLVKEQVSAEFILRDKTIKSPVDMDIVLYDKNSDRKLNAKISVEF